MTNSGELSEYKKLLQQREELERQIREARSRELEDAIAQVKRLVADYDLTTNDVFPLTRRASAGKKVEPKYRNPETGETWTGRGKPPTWIRDVDREKFLISN